jgi:hypothetical protein
MALEDYKKHSIFTYTLLEGLRKTDYNKNLKIEIGDMADYTADQMLVTGKKTGLRIIPMLNLQGMSFPIRTKP